MDYGPSAPSLSSDNTRLSLREVSWESPAVLRPSDFLQTVRDWKPSDDNFPPPHEPVGPGTLRDVREESFYRGGTSTIEPLDGSSDRNAEPAIYDPYPDYNRVQQGFPFPKYGSYSALGLDGGSCTSRFSRLGAYGYAEDGSPPNTNTDAKEDFWDAREGSSSSPPRLHPRSAVILRAWHDLEWTENMKHYVRSLIMELSLHSGAEYEVILLTHVKDNNIPLYGPDEGQNIQMLKDRYIPRGFGDITILWNERTLESWYPRVDEHTPLHQHLQSIQIFSVVYPKFDYYGQLEMDARFTGHAYHFLERAGAFAKEQPRKYLWERNAYFYIPGAHGNWTEFRDMIDETMTIINENLNVHEEDTKYTITWGVDEDADLITFLPIFDPSIQTGSSPTSSGIYPPISRASYPQ
ncbi:hypothetical protein BDW69DRAFT_188705 [Aspergillus filifer]